MDLRNHIGDILEIIYLDASNSMSQRKIRIIKQNASLVIAYCYTRKQIRTFYIENILGWKRVKKARVAS
ncbi:hypothetical protein JOD43_002429 [Pullulanibacillus pueri]|uniref:WYL domain-containing protein n=1 Tax=Pullulanibacillus pueri TaxID=1437324 RepID=A0A8J2ZVA5_9BACL|nr:hypothetical protein [Pullulanibacillus pueri]MBM7682254.1 hypothetical protein [Pullulanibacillus pueri]GGH81074.1 hypothetical protein GCM10007096_18430 [Pullulanibacillus pueri]